MKKEQAMVQAFHEKYGFKVCVGFDTNLLLRRLAFISEETGELAKAIMTNDDNEVVDALVDLMYFILGTGVIIGVDLEKVFAEVHKQNMLKPNKKSKAGKLLKE